MTRRRTIACSISPPSRPDPRFLEGPFHMRRPDYDRRVVVTGLGVISPVGNDKATAWSNLVNGHSGLDQITYFDTAPYEAKLAGEVRDFDAKAWMDPKAARRSESSLHFGVAAAKQALADSGFELTDENRTEVGVVFGSGAGGQQLMIDNYVGLHEKGPRTVAPTFIANALVDSCSGMIAIETGAIGHNVCMVSACATGTHNVGEAAEAIRRGDCVAVISGSSEAPLLEVAHAGFSNMRGMGLPRPGEAPQTVSRPFDATRDGFVLGEGAGSLFLEDLELAKARGAHIYAEVVGYGSAADGWDMVQPIDAGIGSARAMAMALERRGVPADEVDLINPHGTSTPLGDKREAEAIWTVFGERSARDARSLGISATKSMTGHMMGAAGAFEAFATVMSVAEQCAPGTLNYRDYDPECDLWVVAETQGLPIRYALSNNIGLGGHNGAVIFKRYDGD
jgi:beta-ketoacyl-acyl-carrier-protein synthase II